MKTTIRSGQTALADYRQIPRRAHVEITESNLVAEPSPEYFHQAASMSLAAQIFNHVSKFDLGKVLAAPMDVFLDRENVLQPDLLFITKENIFRIERDGIHGAPDLVIEILSPDEPYHDFITKFHLYEKHGVKEFFIVDPETKEAITYFLVNGSFREIYRERGIIRSEILKMEFYV